MKTPLALLAASLLAAPLFAQEQPAAPAAKNAAADELQLIPETPAPLEKPRGSAIDQPGVGKPEKVKPNKTQVAADDVADRIRLRSAKTKALRNPKVQAEWESAEKARTDLERREALKRYYTLLYNCIDKTDPTLKKLTALRRVSVIRKLEQTKIDPTEPLDPDERAERFSRE